MKTPYGHLSYCTNIHAGEHWPEHFAALQQHIPQIKNSLSPDKPFGIGLRLSNVASLELSKPDSLKQFKDWLDHANCYVFTMNGFPYGGFHRTKVKDSVHLPDWTSTDRVVYTVRLFQILAQLLPAEMEGGISTSPLSYKRWHDSNTKQEVFTTATAHILEVAEELIKIKRNGGQHLHLDIEPEPDGLIENGPEFIAWYQQYLLPMGITQLQKTFGYSPAEAVGAIHAHIQLCYDVCHFAVGYENHEAIIKQLHLKGIRVGKIQISAALKASIPGDHQERKAVHKAFQTFDESTYLHQVVALQTDGTLKRYPDLPEALSDIQNPSVKEWRSHFHVPLFISHYGLLQSTQSDIQQVLSAQMHEPFTTHMEVETYTWEVLPDDLKLPLGDSIVREIEWVTHLLAKRETIPTFS